MSEPMLLFSTPISVIAALFERACRDRNVVIPVIVDVVFVVCVVDDDDQIHSGRPLCS